MDKQMEPPTLDEGFSSIVTISSFAAARQSIKLFSADPPLLKFPRTPHLLDLGASTSDDEILSGLGYMQGKITVEEKIDGANMGILLDFEGAVRVQNRSHWVNSADHVQWKSLDRWVAEHDAGIRTVLDRDPMFPERYILYGEWCVARHSILYESLPDRFLAFDLYDRLTATFVSRRVLERVLQGTNIAQVPLVAEIEGALSEEVLRGMTSRRSFFGANRAEGVYVRIEDDERKTTVRRGKVVRGDFIAGNEHWSKGKIEVNKFAAER
jgi:atypical dual specificity phosphatase